MKYYKIIKKDGALAGLTLHPLKLKGYTIVEINKAEYKLLQTQLWLQIQKG